jgi:hypothetical protein
LALDDDALLIFDDLDILVQPLVNEVYWNQQALGRHANGD